MDKQKAIEMLGGTAIKAAQAMGYKSRHAIYMWPEILPQSVTDRVNGALTRIRATKPRKRGPQPSKAKQAAISLETPQERALRIALRVNRNTHFDHPTQADKDRTASVAGRFAFHESEK